MKKWGSGEGWTQTLIYKDLYKATLLSVTDTLRAECRQSLSSRPVPSYSSNSQKKFLQGHRRRTQSLLFGKEEQEDPHLGPAGRRGLKNGAGDWDHTLSWVGDVSKGCSIFPQKHPVLDSSPTLQLNQPPHTLPSFFIAGWGYRRAEVAQIGLGLRSLLLFQCHAMHLEFDPAPPDLQGVPSVCMFSSMCALETDIR